jgi:hypothetical protein
VEAAGGDHDEVLAWVQSHGGGHSRTRPIQSRGLRAGRMVAPPPIPGVEFYWVPVRILKAPHTGPT